MNRFVLYHIKNMWALLIAVLLLPALAQAQTPLLRSYTGSLDASQNAMLQKLSELPSTERVRVVYIDVKAFRSDAVTVNPFDEISIPLRKVDVGHTGINLRSWTGTHPPSMASGAFVLDGQRVSGHVSGLQGNFEIFPMGDEGVHAVVEHDNEAFRSCGNSGGSDGEDHDRSPEIEEDEFHHREHQDEGRQQQPGSFSSALHSPESNDAECFVRVLVGYTSGAQTNTLSTFGRTMIEHVSLAVLESNQGYANSDVEQRMELAYLYEADDDETSSAADDLDAMNDDNDGKWDEMYTHRATYKADMVCLITDGGYSGLCGRAYGFDYTDPDNFFQVTEFDCATGNFSFAHEFGHNQGCRHDNDNTGSPFSYARGFNEGSNFRTIMAVCCSPTRVNFWSNPDVDFQTFGATGTADRDNARALDAGDATVSHHQTTNATAVVSGTLEDDHWANYFATDFVESSSIAESGSFLELKSFGPVTLKTGFHAQQGSSMRAWVEEDCDNVSFASVTGPGAADVQEDVAQTSQAGPVSLAESGLASNDVAVYPNPFTRTFTLAANLDEDARISISVVDPSGRVLRQLAVDKKVQSGWYESSFSTEYLSEGIYYLVIDSDNMRSVKKIVKSE